MTWCSKKIYRPSRVPLGTAPPHVQVRSSYIFEECRGLQIFLWLSPCDFPHCIWAPKISHIYIDWCIIKNIVDSYFYLVNQVHCRIAWSKNVDWKFGNASSHFLSHFDLHSSFPIWNGRNAIFLHINYMYMLMLIFQIFLCRFHNLLTVHDTMLP